MLVYPRGVFLFWLVALIYELSYSLYGIEPEGQEFGVHLGNQQPRGERGTLLKGADTLVRASCNPFFPYVSERVAEQIGAP